MASEWPKTTLKNAGVTLIDCVHKTPKAKDDGYPYIGIPQLKDGRIAFDANPRLISGEDLNLWTVKAKPQTNDVILSRRCNPGETAHVSDETPFALGQNLVLLRSSGDDLHPPFLRWITRSPQWWWEVDKYLNVGAVFNSLRCADIPSFEIPFPPLPEQKAIAHILGSLDDKIELNRRMNETLEGMAQALFKSWFVDFDPVIDNALEAGNPIPEPFAARAEVRRNVMAGSADVPVGTSIKKGNGANEDVGAPRTLFPAAFHETEELGWIPEGWEVSTIGEEVDSVGGATPSTKNSDFWDDGDIHWTTPKDLSNLNSRILLDTDRKITEAGLNKISSGLLPVDTVLMSSRAPVGYLALAKIPVAINQGYIAMKCTKQLTPEYVIQWADSVMDDIKQRAGGTTFAEISKKNFRGIPAIVPNSGALELYSQTVKEFYDKVTANLKESTQLENLRDTLLPKLISGELRIEETEKMVEDEG